MGIEIRKVNTETGPQSAPVVVCDQCGEVIINADMALYQWKDIDGHIFDGSLVFLHKGKCNNDWDETHNDIGSWSNIELRYFPI
jgi:hypothetical protein